MALVEKFYNNDRARDIRELLTNNFENVARYIPNNFLILDTTERQNLIDDYKTHFKLVFDKEMERVYRWSDIKRNWEQYLIYAWDEYARTEADTNTDRAFAEVTLGKNMSGQNDPYTFTFYNRKNDAKDSVTLQALNVKFNGSYSVQTIIQKLLDDLASLDDFVGVRGDILNNADLTAKTVTGAIKEVNNKTIDNKVRLDDIESGATKVPEAIHAEHADLADIATLAKDSEKFGGQLPNYYAKKSDLDGTADLLNDTIARVAKNETDITGLQTKTDTTNANLAALDAREARHYAEYQLTRNKVESNSVRIGELDDAMDELRVQLGWEILYN